MVTRILLSLAAAAALAGIAGCSEGGQQQGAAADPAPEKAGPQAALNVETAVAQEAEALPVGTVPGTVTLPPEARVAVSSPLPGAALRVFVIEGETVRPGQPLALVRAAEPVQIRADLARAQAELFLAQARARRLQQLADEGIIAGARLDEARAQLQQARVTVSENQRIASLTGAGADGTMTLRSPIGGRVAQVAVETGGPVDPMTAPFVVENAGAYRLDLQVPARLARSITPGMGIEVRLPVNGGDPLIVGGSILSVTPSIDPATRSVLAKATIGAVPGLVPGQNVSVTIQGSMATGGVEVPGAAVARIEGEDYVFVRSGTRFAARKVEVAAEAGGRAVITQGLRPGDVVAVSSIPELKAAAAE